MNPKLHIWRLVLCAALIVIGLLPAVSGAADTSKVYVLRLDDEIDKNHARYLHRGLESAQKAGAKLVIIEIDTPGGLVDAMRDMVRDILASQVPVVTYVAPQGARAGSAGAFISAAGHIAAMAPGTNIGASTPVGGGGEDLPRTLASKATNDAAALMRSIADERGRNADKLEKMVREAASYSAKEAVESNIVNLLADNMNDLLAKIDGMKVRVNGQDMLLQTQGVSCMEPRAACAEIGQSLFEGFMDFIGNPNVAYILLALGGLGLFFEMLNPGLIAPGVIGGILLILAFLGLGNLAVNWAGVALVLLGVLLFILELHVSGFGILGIGSIISLILGAFLLFAPFSPAPPTITGPRAHINPWVIVGLGSSFGVGVAAVVMLAWRGKREPPAVPPPSNLVGMVGRVVTPLNPTGIVQVAGESWTAEGEGGAAIPVDERVEVVGLGGLTLRVRKAPDSLSAG